jgi:hypothetical protein
MPRYMNLGEHEQYVLRDSGLIEIGNKVFEVSEGGSLTLYSIPH